MSTSSRSCWPRANFGQGCPKQFGDSLSWSKWGSCCQSVRGISLFPIAILRFDFMRISLSIVASLLLIAPAWADDKAQPKSFSIPYKLTFTNHVMVRAKINGKRPYNFIVDTGAPALFVATKVAEKVGAKADKSGWGTFDKFELEGGLVIEKAKGRIDDPFQLEGMNGMGLAGVELHGMIGYNILAKYKITYDFTSDKLVLTELPGFDPGKVP